MAENVTESYEIKNEIKELHVLDVIAQALDRHLSTTGHNTTSEEFEAHLKTRRIACLEFALNMEK